MPPEERKIADRRRQRRAKAAPPRQPSDSLLPSLEPSWTAIGLRVPLFRAIRSGTLGCGFRFHVRA
jgi:hypothetical protein